MFGFYDHETCPNTGRPLPHDTWLREAALIWVAFAGIAVLMIVAAHDFAQYGRHGRALELLGFTAVFGLLALGRHLELKAKRRAWREALAEYEAEIAARATIANPD